MCHNSNPLVLGAASTSLPEYGNPPQFPANHLYSATVTKHRSFLQPSDQQSLDAGGVLETKVNTVVWLSDTGTVSVVCRNRAGLRQVFQHQASVAVIAT